MKNNCELKETQEKQSIFIKQNLLGWNLLGSDPIVVLLLYLGKVLNLLGSDPIVVLLLYLGKVL